MKIFQPIITGSLQVSGSVTAIDFTGSLYGTSSYAITASYAMNGGGGGAGFPFTGSAVITGSLIVTGSTISTLGFTGSLYGTASWANNVVSASYASTASFLLGSVTSASYATTSSYTTTASYAATASYATSFTIDGTITKGASVASSIVGSNNLFTQATGSYTAAFGKYALYNGANARAGEFITVWNGTTTTYTDYSTTDVGSSSDITFSSAIVSGDIQINAVALSSGWTVKMITTFI